MADFDWDKPATPVAAKPRPIAPVPMAAPAAVVATDPLVAAMQTRNASAAAAPVAAAPAMPVLPPPPKQEMGEAPVNYKRRLSEYYQRIDQMKIDAVKETDKAARDLANPQVKNEGQGLATGFGMRMKESNAILNAMEDQGITNTGVTRSVVSGILGAIPAIGGPLEEKTSAAMNVLPSWVGGPNAEQQQVEQARRNFITAILRKESGAVISPQEFYAEEKKYFPQLGDEAPVIQQKRAAREIAIRAMDIQSGNKAPNAALPNALPAAPPPAALKEGHVTTFKNGQQWILKNGKPEKVN